MKQLQVWPGSSVLAGLPNPILLTFFYFCFLMTERILLLLLMSDLGYRGERRGSLSRCDRETRDAMS